MAVMQIAGYSNTGKTRLIEALCQQLPGPVLVVKFSHHRPRPDRVGSDTDRFAHAGAHTVLMQPYQATWRSPFPLPIDWKQVDRWYPWILWEGAKSVATPKIVVGSELLVQELDNVRAVIGPTPPSEVDLWFKAPLPLTLALASQAAAWIIEHHMALSFSVDNIPVLPPRSSERPLGKEPL